MIVKCCATYDGCVIDSLKHNLSKRPSNGLRGGILNLVKDSESFSEQARLGVWSHHYHLRMEPHIKTLGITQKQVHTCQINLTHLQMFHDLFSSPYSTSRITTTGIMYVLGQLLTWLALFGLK